VAYNLGANTRRMQVDAVCARLMQPRKPGETDEEAIARLPKTATHMMLCVECRRVANACQNGSGKDVTFNELGAHLLWNLTRPPTNARILSRVPV
jgi:hypothetical protein